MRLNVKQILAVTAISLVAIPTFAGGAGKVSLNDFHIISRNSAKKDTHRETISIDSWSLGATNGNTYRGLTTVNEGILTMTATTVPASVGELCQSHAKIPSMTIEADGQRKEFRDVAFQQCPGGGAGGTFTLTYNIAPGAIAASVPQATPNATISGITPTPAPIHLTEMTLAANSATMTMTKELTGTLVLNSANWVPGRQVPSLVIESKRGTKVTFSKVTFGDLVVSSAKPGVPEKQTFTIQFESTTATSDLAVMITLEK